MMCSYKPVLSIVQMSCGYTQRHKKKHNEINLFHWFGTIFVLFSVIIYKENPIKIKK